MRKNKRSEMRTGRRIMGILLALILAAATPVCIYADAAETAGAVDAGGLSTEISFDDISVIEEGAEAASADSVSGDAALGEETEGDDTVSGDSILEDDEESSVSSNETPDGSVSADDIPVDSVSFNKLPYGLPGMGEDYILSREMMERKYELMEHDVLASLRGLTEGIDYEERKLILGTEDEEFARQVAAAYGAEFGTCEYGIATMYLPEEGISVLEAVEVGMDPSYNIPPVEPNYYMALDPDVPEEEFAHTPAEINAAGTQVASRQSYDTIYPKYANDPFLNPRNSNYQWFHDMVHTYAAWGVTTGSAAVKVAVIDTGVSKHQEFGSRLVRYGYTGTGAAADDSGHGTNVAGIIGAGLNNGYGGAGIAPGVTILGYPTFVKKTSSGRTYVTGDTEAIIKAIKHASDKDKGNADIISMSLGGPYYNSQFNEAVQYAYKNGVTVVCSAGNGFSNSLNYPGSYPHVIAVTAVDYSGKKAGFSNTGSWVDVAAPGYRMWSTGNGASSNSHVDPSSSNTTTYSNYVMMSGTSQATPVVTGACALYMSAKGHVDPDTMEKVIKRSVSKGSGSGLGKGIIDLPKMFASDRTAPAIMNSASSGSKNKTVLGPGESIQINENSSVVTSRGLNQPAGGKILYTINGKNPAILNGNIVNGTLYTGALSYASLINKYPAGSKVTVKAAAVTGLGVLTNVKTVTFTMGKNVPTSLTINAPLKKSGSNYVINAGGKATLKAVALPAGSPSKATWAIDKTRTTATLTGAKINAKTGALTTKAGQTGTIYVVCTSTVKNTVKGEAAIVVQNSPLAAGIKLDKTKMSVYAGNTMDLTVSSVTWPKSVKTPPALGTLPFSWSSSNTKVATLSYATATPYKATIRGVSKGTAKITCSLLDGSGRKVVCTVTVKQYATTIGINGPFALPKGASGKYTAAVRPTNANNKGVTWSLVLTAAFKDKVTINAKTGAVKVASDAPTGTFQVKAVSKDGNASTTFNVKVIDAATKSIKLTPSTYNANAAIPVTSSTGSLKSIRLYTSNLPETSSYDETLVRLMPTLTDKNNVAMSDIMLAWSSSNPKVVNFTGSVSSKRSSGGETIHAVKPGTAKITCKALDGSGRSATVIVKVIVPASGLELSPVGGQYTIATGKSGKVSAAAGKLHGKPSVSKVKWDFQMASTTGTSKISSGKGTGFTADASITQLVKKFGLVKVKNGKVTVHKGFATVFKTFSYYPGIIVTATTTDGTNYSDTTYFFVNNAGSYIKIKNGSYGRYISKAWTFRNREASLPIVTNCSGNITVKSSNPRVASAYVNNGALQLVTYSKKGTVKITLKAGDGSGKKKTITVQVR